MTPNRLRWYHGLLALALFAGVLALEYFGLLGKGVVSTVIGEVLFAVIAVGVAVVARARLSDVFTFRRIRWVHLAGLYLMWRAVLAIELVLGEILLHFFPEMSREGTGIETWIRSMPYALAILVIAVMPAICEEFLFRGALLRSEADLKKPWLIILLNGVIFGAAHMSSLKLTSVTLLGVLLAYVVYRSNNLGYSIILHFLNNSWAVTYTYLLLKLSDAGAKAGGSAAGYQMTRIPVGVIGATVCAAALAPMLLYIGNNLFTRPENNAQLPPGQRKTLKRDWLLLTGALAILIFAVGMLLFSIGFEEVFRIGIRNL